MLRLLNTIVILLILSLFWAFFFHAQLLLASVNFLVMPIIGLMYFIFRNWKFNKIDKLMLFIFIIATIGDTITVFQKKNFLDNVPIVITFVVHIIYMVIFRMQGAFAFVNTSKDYLKIILPSVIIFFTFGVFLNSVPSSVFFLLMLYAIQEAILFVLAFFREVDKKSFNIGIYGSAFMVLSDFLYALYYFKTNKPILYVLMAVTNIIAQYLLTIGISRVSNDKEKGTLKIPIIDRIILFLRIEFRNMKLHFVKNIHNSSILHRFNTIKNYYFQL